MTSRGDRYRSVLAQLGAVVRDCPDLVSAMASSAALLKQSFPEFTWTGYYLPAPDGSLVVGPYQGPLACIRLPPGRGVCGAAARRRETVVVPDVAAFSGHIACDPSTRSEIVVPLVRGGELLAVLDVDSDRPSAFGPEDREGLERVAALVAARHAI